MSLIQLITGVNQLITGGNPPPAAPPFVPKPNIITTPSRTLPYLLNITPGLLGMQTQNVPWLPYKPSLGPVVGGGSPLSPAPTLSNVPQFVSSYFDPNTDFGFGGPLPWDSSTELQGFSTPAPLTTAPPPTYSETQAASATPWEDSGSSILSALAPLFL